MAGGKALLFPTIRIVGPPDWVECDIHLNQLDEFDWIIFSSANAVRFFLERVRELNIKNPQVKVAAVGIKTSKKLEEYGWPADLIPQEYSARGILKAFRSIDIRENKILIPASDIGRDELIKGLENQGAYVTTMIMYRTQCLKNVESEKIVKTISEGEVNVILFYSPSAFSCFISALGNQIVGKIIKEKVAIAAIGPTTSKAIKKSGLDVDIMPEKSTDESLVDAINNYYDMKTETESN